MTHKKHLGQIKKVYAAIKPFTSKERRNLAWQILMNETIRKNKEGLKWLKDHYDVFIKNSNGDFKKTNRVLFKTKERKK
jgi:hypothetical protein